MINFLMFMVLLLLWMLAAIINHFAHVPGVEPRRKLTG
jgi:hypothetical protein